MDSDINKKNILRILNNKNFQIIAVLILLLIILSSSVHIRTLHMNNLVDSTSGKKIPLALDPYYFLRVAETKVTNNGLPECDNFRVLAGECVEWNKEILPDSSILIYNIGKVFDSEFTLREAHVINPVVFFVLSLIVFFFLIYVLTNSRIAALLGTSFLGFIPTYLYRTMAGFSDHESIGMFAFFSLLLCFSISMKYLNKKVNFKTYKIAGLGILTSFLSALTIVSWGGIANFVFMIIPFSVLIFWIVKRKNKNFEKLKNTLIFYVLWIVFSLIFSLIRGFELMSLINRYFLSSTGLISVFVLGFIIVDFVVIYLKNNKIINSKYDILYSLGILMILGLLFLIISGEISIIGDVYNKILNPFGSGRVGETVAENKSPSLENWKNQTGPVFFWIFLLGLIVIGNEISKRVSKEKKRKYLFLLFWVLMVFGIIFSSHSSLNNLDFLKKILYFGSVILFLVYSIWLYFKEDKFKLNTRLIVILSWMLFMLIAARSAVRLFFVITPFVCFSASFAVIKIFDYYRKNKDELIKILFGIIFVLVVVGLIFSLNNFYESSKIQSKNTFPSANSQWQNSMKWVRENTSENSIFLHWWDYGYWVEYLGERPTLSDGGHFEGSIRDHMIGRYILTNENPDSALSFMESNNASYLLIDPTDIGKYSAYSRIGSGEEMKDRYSWIPSMISDTSQIKETRNGTIRLYQGGGVLDEDLIYENNNSEIFLPSGKAGIGGIQLEIINNQIKQPIGIFVYNNQRYNIPLRYVYYNEEIYDFKSGIEATAFVIPRVYQQNSGYSVDSFGALLYLSPKTMHSLVSELYLMNDAFNKYPTIKLAYKEPDPTLKYFNSQGGNLGNFAYFRGLRGPIKIFDTREIPENIIINEEFRQRIPYGDNWEFGILDNLEFVK